MSEISVVVVGSTNVSSVVGNGDTVNVNVGNQTVGGGNGAAATIEAGSVTTIDATQTATVTNVGTAYAAKFNFSLPRGFAGSNGPANSLSIGSVTTGTTAAVSISGAAPSQTLSFVLQSGPVGPAGPANSLSIGSVSTGTTAAVSISGTAPSQTLSFVLPQGPAGAPNSLSIGSVSTGTTAAVTITGSAPSQSISFVLPQGPRGDVGPAGPAGPPINLGDETPQALGTASAGSAFSASRADHVHSVPVIAYGNLTGVPSTFAPSAHTHTVSEVSGLQAALDGKQAAGSYATLVGGQVPSSMLPSFVDDVVDVGGTLPATGDVGKIYVVSTGANTNKIYRWSGSTFVEISPSPGSTDSVTEGSVNLYHTNARAAAAAPVQSVAGRTGIVTLAKSDVGLGNVDNTADASKPVSVSQAAADTAVQSFSIQRSNHTGTQTASTISDFATEAAKYGPVVSVAGRTGAVTLAQLASSGTASATTFLRGDGAWAEAGSGDGSGYVLPTASASVLGGIKVGSGLAIASGVLSTTGGGGGSANIVEAATAAGFPATGATGTLYHATDVHRIYFWDETNGVFVEAGPSGGGGADSFLGSFFLPPAPTNVTASAGNAQATLSWTAPTVLSVTPITDYSVQFKTAAASTWTTFSRTASTTASQVVTGLTNGTAYVFRVAGINGIGTGAYSTASSAVTPTVGDPLFSNVSLLLHMDSGFSDSSLVSNAFSGVTSSDISTSVKKFGGGSFALTSNVYKLDNPAAMQFGSVGTFTVECWAYRTSGQMLLWQTFTNTGGAGGHVVYADANGQLVIYERERYVISASSATQLPANGWFHVAMSVNADAVSLYIDGVRVGTGDFTAGRGSSGSDKCWIGGDIYGTVGGGFIDEFRVTKNIARYSGETLTKPVSAFPDS